MLKTHLLLIQLLIIFMLIGGCSTSTATLPAHKMALPTALEYPVTDISMAGPITDSDAEISGLTWYGDYLILLPQYPERLDNSLYALPKQAIQAVLTGSTTDPLTPQPIPLVAPGLTDIAGFEGLEAIVFIGDDVFITIETSPGNEMLGYIIKGTIAPDLSQIVLETDHLTEIAPQADITNYTDETIFNSGDSLITLYEANGHNVNPKPNAHVFDTNLTPQETIPFVSIEYRITDATRLDTQNRFWAINYLFDGSINKLNPAVDTLVETYGIGPTHATVNTVERLVEFVYTPNGINLTGTPPIQLQLPSDNESRNWEGLVRLDNRGFLLVTDKFPGTLLGFVPLTN